MADLIPDRYTAIYIAEQSGLGSAADASGTAGNAIEVLSYDFERIGPGVKTRANRRNGLGGGRQPVFIGEGIRIDYTIEILPPPTPGVSTNWQQELIWKSSPMTTTDGGSVYEFTPVAGCVEGTDYHAMTVDIDTPDGARIRAMDCINHIKELRFPEEGCAELDGSFYGIYVADAAASGTAPAPVGLELPIPCTGSTFDFGWHSAHDIVKGMKFIPGQTVHTPRTGANTDGQGQTSIIYGEDARIEYMVERKAQGTLDHHAELRSNTGRTVAIDINGGTGAGQFSIESPAAGSSLSAAVEVVEDELQMINCVQTFFSISGDNDFFKLSLR